MPSMSAKEAKQLSQDEWARWRWELRLPTWQRRINRFCENWIFAFFVAMLIRHFGVEAYRIPTASMEPMLYGDPAFSRADHVVVDKLLFRFTGPERWGVTVFQFPWPEVAGPQGPAKPVRAWDGHDGRSDSFPFNPQLNRNFVKRCVVKPGDRFYISGGDVYVQDGDQWVIPTKPDDIQEALWMPIYQHGAEADYLPWEGIDGAYVEQRERGLAIAPREHAVRFTQPLTNLYLKPGEVNVQPITGGPYARVQASMTEPLFTYNASGRTRTGSIWDLRKWRVQRLTSADLDNAAAHGTQLNAVIDEYIGDLRLRFSLRDLQESVTLTLDEGDAVAIRLHFAEQGWQFTVDGALIAEGNDSPLNHTWTLVNCDNRVHLQRGDEMLCEPVAVAATDPNVQRSRITWGGAGEAVLGSFTIDRELHYAARGFLRQQASSWAPNPSRMRKEDFDAIQKQLPVTRHELIVMREQMLQQLVDAKLRERLLASLEQARSGRASSDEWLQPIGVNPQTALEAPEDGYLLLGDNSPFSWDGRNWGWVPGANLRGEVLLVVFPIGRAKVVE